MSKKWEMPQWMTPYIETIAPGSRDNPKSYVEEMVNDETPYQINAPRALVALEVKGRVSALEALQEKGFLTLEIQEIKEVVRRCLAIKDIWMPGSDCDINEARALQSMHEQLVKVLHG